MNAPFAHSLHVAGWPKLLCYLSHASLECPPRCGGIDHLANTANMIGRRILVDHNMLMAKVRVPTKLLWGSNEERGLAIPQFQEQCP
jgi:hypothetical protein